MLYNVVLTHLAVDKILSATIQMKTVERYFPVHWAPLIMLHKVVLTFESVYEVLKCAHFNESYVRYKFWSLDNENWSTKSFSASQKVPTRNTKGKREI